MSVKITKSNIEGKSMTTFFDKDKKPIKTVHSGASGYLDYTIAPHDEERRNKYMKSHNDKKLL